MPVGLNFYRISSVDLERDLLVNFINATDQSTSTIVANAIETHSVHRLASFVFSIAFYADTASSVPISRRVNPFGAPPIMAIRVQIEDDFVTGSRQSEQRYHTRDRTKCGHIIRFRSI